MGKVPEAGLRWRMSERVPQGRAYSSTDVRDGLRLSRMAGSERIKQNRGVGDRPTKANGVSPGSLGWAVCGDQGWPQ